MPNARNFGIVHGTWSTLEALTIEYDANSRSSNVSKANLDCLGKEMFEIGLVKFKQRIIAFRDKQTIVNPRCCNLDVLTKAESANALDLLALTTASPESPVLVLTFFFTFVWLVYQKCTCPGRPQICRRRQRREFHIHDRPPFRRVSYRRRT